MDKNFKFKLGAKVSKTDSRIYSAKLIDEQYEVTWEPDKGKKKEYVKYFIDTVEKYVSGGIWYVVK